VAINLIEALGAAEEASKDRITIYVPSCDRDGNPVDFESFAVAAMELLSEVGGGATRMPPVQGAWLNRDSGVLIVEEVTLVYSFVDGDALAAKIPKIRQFLHRMGRTLNQGEVVVEISDRFYKITAFDA
jgi:hypothetical protein